MQSVPATLTRSAAIALCAAAGNLACGGYVPPEDAPIVVDTDTFRVAADPPGGEFAGSVTVALHSEEPATIYYTTDGTPPTDNGTMYEGPFEISDTTMLTIAAVTERGVWCRPVIEHYKSVPLSRPPIEAPRILSLSRPQLYFSAKPGDGILEETVYATSVGSQHLMIHRAYITAARETSGFYEPGVFRLETQIPESTLLAPGDTIELRITYRPTETLRSASLVFETDDMRTEDGLHEVRLSGRIFNW